MIINSTKFYKKGLIEAMKNIKNEMCPGSLREDM